MYNCQPGQAIEPGDHGSEKVDCESTSSSSTDTLPNSLYLSSSSASTSSATPKPSMKRSYVPTPNESSKEKVLDYSLLEHIVK